MENDDAFTRMPSSQVDFEGGDHGHSHSHGDNEKHGHGDEKKEKKGHGHGHDAVSEESDDMKNFKASMKKLKLVSFVSIFFIAAQLTGGYLANSIAIYTDSAHLASDMIGFAMSMAALKMAMRPASKELTFGWHRAEILGTLCSIVFLLTLTIWLVFEAADRVISKPEVKGFEMIITAVAGLGFNLIQMHILHQGEGGYQLGEKAGHGHSHDDDGEGGHGHSHGGGGGANSLAVDAAFLHALSDMIMSIGVCIAAGIIEFATYKYGFVLVDETCEGPDCEKKNFQEQTDCVNYWHGTEEACAPIYHVTPEVEAFFIADPICTFVFSLLVCMSVTPIVSKCVGILMEGSPPGFDTDGLLDQIHALAKGDDEIVITDFHLWSISQGKMALSAHVRTNDPQRVLKGITQLCKNKFNIDHSTIQIEDSSPGNEHQFESEQTLHKTLPGLDIKTSPSRVPMSSLEFSPTRVKGHDH